MTVMIAAFLIWTVLSVLFVIFAVRCRHSDKPARFWANVPAPEVTDVKEYNRKVSNLWIVFSVLFELLGVTFLFCRQNSPLVIVPYLGTVFLVLLVMVLYSGIESRYRK